MGMAAWCSLTGSPMSQQDIARSHTARVSLLVSMLPLVNHHSKCNSATHDSCAIVSWFVFVYATHSVHVTTATWWREVTCFAWGNVEEHDGATSSRRVVEVTGQGAGGWRSETSSSLIGGCVVRVTSGVWLSTLHLAPLLRAVFPPASQRLQYLLPPYCLQHTASAPYLYSFYSIQAMGYHTRGLAGKLTLSNITASPTMLPNANFGIFFQCIALHNLHGANASPHEKGSSYRPPSHAGVHFEHKRKLDRRIATGDNQLAMMQVAAPISSISNVINEVPAHMKHSKSLHKGNSTSIVGPTMGDIPDLGYLTPSRHENDLEAHTCADSSYLTLCDCTCEKTILKHFQTTERRRTAKRQRHDGGVRSAIHTGDTSLRRTSWSTVRMEQRRNEMAGKRKIPVKTRRPAASSGHDFHLRISSKFEPRTRIENYSFWAELSRAIDRNFGARHKLISRGTLHKGSALHFGSTLHRCSFFLFKTSLPRQSSGLTDHPTTTRFPACWCSGRQPIITLASHQGELGSISGRVTGFSQVGLVPDDAIGRRVLSGYHLVACYLTSPSPNQLLFHSLPEFTTPLTDANSSLNTFHSLTRPHKYGLPTPLCSPPHHLKHLTDVNTSFNELHPISFIITDGLLPHHPAPAISTYPSPILLPFSAPFPVLAPPPPHTDPILLQHILTLAVPLCHMPSPSPHS
ncbi:hypothetical protein PR048_020734 [Dryococelus australis]|uniref:Uncharacterized protein n=1 Tax=Dryococelus australis TaxID=614101 RepID=A0ABQ9H737_9NEOP|nr:hypothetical protein PR048_020734 [Dryococelus australis]